MMHLSSQLKRIIALAVLAVLVAPQASLAAFNTEINYQGRLVNNSNIAVPNGTYNMRFNLYTSSSGGTAVWTETRTGGDRVQVTNGLFSIMLGSVSSLSGIDWDQTLYLGVEIGGTSLVPSWDGEMLPRKILGAVPAAFTAFNVIGENASTTYATSTYATSTNFFSQFANITNATTTNIYSTNAEFANIITGSQTITDLLFNRATGTEATTTNFFSSVASSTNLFSTIANIGALVFGNATGTAATTTSLFANTASSTNLFATVLNAGDITSTGIGTFSNLFLSGSTTLQNFTFANATGTAATTTSFFASVASSTNLFSTSANIGALVFGNATGTAATTTNFFSSVASSTNLYSTNASLAFAAIGNSTTTAATSTSSFATTASSTNLFSTSANFGTATVGSLTASGITATYSTTTSATTTNLAITGLTAGSIPFATTGGSIAQNNSQLFWDRTQTYLGLGINTPSEKFHVSGGVALFNAASTGVGAGLTSGLRIAAPIGSSHYNWMIGAQQNVSGGFEITPSDSANSTSFSTPGLVVSSGRDVGIGDNTPDAKLDVAGTVQVDGKITSTVTSGEFLANTSGGSSALAMRIGNSNNDFYIGTEGNVAGSFFTGALANSSVLYSSTAIQQVIGGVARMIVNTSGNVGIGTTNPSDKLEVGTVSSGGNLRLYSSSYGSNGLARFYGTDGTEKLQIGTGGATNAFIFTPASVDLSLYAGNTERVTIKSDGNIGIGRTDPEVTLDVAGVTRVGTAAVGGDLRLEGKSGSGFPWRIRTTSGTGLHFQADNGIGQVSFLDNGNVGIGTTTPQGRLSVSGGVAIFDNPNGAIRILKTTGTFSSDDLGIWNRGDGIFALADWNSGSNGVFINTGNGNVGVGTTTPAFKLDVYGNARVNAGTGRNFAVVTDASQQGTDGIAIGSFNDVASAYAPLSVVSSKTVFNSSVGIGTTNPLAKLDIRLGTNGEVARIYGGDGSGVITFYEPTGNAARGYIGYGDSGDLFTGAITNSFAIRSDNDLHIGSGGNNIRMTIETGGDVGIGTTNPTELLDVNGNIETHAKLGFNGDSTNYYINGISNGMEYRPYSVGNFTFNSGGGTWAFTNGDFRIGASTGNARLTVRGTTANSSAYAIEAANSSGNTLFLVRNDGQHSFYGSDLSEKVTITSAGNIGIGTTNPSFSSGAGLAINRGAASTLRLESTGSGGTSAEISYTDTALVFTQNNGSNNRPFIFTNGNVGIDNTLPAAFLHIGTDEATTDAAQIIINDNASFRGEFGYNESGNTIMHIANTFNDNAARFDIRMKGKTSSDAKLTILGSGNVGIGVTNPGNALDVNGTVQAANFRDSILSSNVNLGSSGSEGRGVVAGFSGGNYSGIGYNIRHTSSSGTYIAPGADTVSYLRFDNAGFNFYGAAAGSAGRSLTLSLLMGLNSSGNLGVGTSPSGSHKLYVAGNTFVNGVLSSGAGTEGWVNTKSLLWGTDGLEANYRWQSYLSGNDLMFFSRGTGTDVMSFVYSTGNVGIGITNPGARFDVRENSTGLAMDLRNTNSSGFGMSIIGGSGSNYALAVNDYQGNNIMRVLGNGNVGIGVTNPQYRLSLGSSNDQIGFFSDSTHFGNIKFYDGTTGGMYFNNQSAAGAGYHFQNAGTEILTLTAAGSLGIGITNPDAPLHVFGGTDMTSGWDRTATLEATFPVLVFNSNDTKWAGVGYDYSSNFNIWVNGSSNDVTGTGSRALSIDQSGNIRAHAGLTSSGTFRADVNSNLIGTGRAIYGNDDATNYTIGDNGSGLLNINWFGGTRISSAAGEVMRVTSGGGVAIGSTNPDPLSRSFGRALSVSSASSAGIEINSASGNTAELALGVNGTRIGTFNATSASLEFGSVGSSNLNFITNNSIRMQVLAGGNVSVANDLGVSGVVTFGSHDGLDLHNVERYHSTAPFAILRAGSSDNNTEVGWQFQGRNGAGDAYDALTIVGSTGNVGIGTTNPATALEVIGDVSLSGTLSASDITASTGSIDTLTVSSCSGCGGVDIAENYIVSEEVEAGDIISVDVTGGSAMVKKAGTTTTGVLGIVSTRPGLILSENGTFLGRIASTSGFYLAGEEAPIALAGRVPVKFSEANGQIKAGDYVTLSTTTPGYAVKITSPGIAIGQALEDGEGDKVLVFVTHFFYDPSGVDLSTLASKIDALDVRVTTLESALTGSVFFSSTTTSSSTALTVSTTTSGFVASVFEAIGAVIGDSWTRFTKLAADTFRVGSPENPTGITLYDSINGSAYCLRIYNGQSMTSPGECSGVALQQPVSNGGNQNQGSEVVTQSQPDNANTNTDLEETIEAAPTDVTGEQEESSADSVVTTESNSGAEAEQLESQSSESEVIVESPNSEESSPTGDIGSSNEVSSNDNSESETL